MTEQSQYGCSDEEILAAIGLSEEETADLIRKHQAYLQSLNTGQHQLVKLSLPSWEQAAAAISPNCTVADLDRFISARGDPPDLAGALCVPMVGFVTTESNEPE